MCSERVNEDCDEMIVTNKQVPEIFNRASLFNGSLNFLNKNALIKVLFISQHVL